jgi:hypothetical protein
MRAGNWLFLAGALALFGAVGHAAAAPVTKVPVEIFGSSADVAAYPIEVGLPLPPGALKDIAQLRLLDGTGRPVSLQAEILGRYPDESLRSVLLVFLAPLKKQAASTYTVEFGEGVRGEPAQGGLTCRAKDGAAEVDTGVVRFRAVRGARRILEGLSADGKALGDGISLFLVEKGQERPSFEIENTEVVVEESGPVRAVVCIRGRFSRAQSSTAFEVRVHAYAGSSLVRLQHVIAGASEKEEVRWTGWGLRVDGPAGKPTVGVDGKSVDLPVKEGGGLVQDGQVVLVREDAAEREFRRLWAYRLTCALRGEAAAPARADGWAAATLGAGEIAVGVRDFWQQFPKGFSAGADGLTVWLHHPAGRPFIAKPGTAKTHELFLDIRPAGRGSAATAPALNAAFQEWPHARVAPLWTCASGVFGPLLPRGDKLTGPYDRMIDFYLEYILARAKVIDSCTWHMYGNGEFGDVSMPWPVGTPNINHPWSPARAYFLEYQRGGNREWARLAARMARHSMDIDYPWPGPGEPTGQKVAFTTWVGNGKACLWTPLTDRLKTLPDIDTVLKEERQRELPLARHQSKQVGYEEKGTIRCGLGGLMPFYLGHGDRRALALARKQGERILDGQKEVRWNSFAYDVSNLLDAYEASGEARFLAGAVEAARRGLAGGDKTLKNTDYGFPPAMQAFPRLLELMDLNRDQATATPLRKAFADWAAASMQGNAGAGCISARESYLYSFTAAANSNLWRREVMDLFRKELANSIISGYQFGQLNDPLDAKTVPFQRVEKQLGKEDPRMPRARARSPFYCFGFESGLENSMIVFPPFLAEFKKYREQHLKE